MTERLSSLLILLGGLLVLLALWYLSYLFVRWDTRRRGISELKRKAWVATAIGLPLIGFAIYLFNQVLHSYLASPADPHEPVSGTQTEVRVGAFDPRVNLDSSPPRQVPMPEPAWSEPAPPRSNGAQAHKTPATVPSAYVPLRTRYALVAMEGPHLGQHFLLDHLPARIGRGPETDVALDQDLNVSRKHAEVYEWNGILRIRDLGSSHGTHINGTRASDQALSPGDRLTVGSTMLILRELP